MTRDALRRARIAAAATTIALLTTVPAAIAAAETADEFVARTNAELATLLLRSMPRSGPRRRTSPPTRS
jgi:hypothetical protein